jgi:two-component system phosphate regulon sensor histidine kinase PhoR
MTKKIFQSILLVAGCVLLASLLIIVGFLYDYFGGVEKNQLRDELSLAAAAVEDGGTDYLSQLTADRYRLTWIAADGSVLYDTKTNAESLENHASRAEVSQALARARAIPRRSWKRPCTTPSVWTTARCCAFPSAARRSA